MESLPAFNQDAVAGPLPEALRGMMDADAQMFDLAPVSLWLEDYSALRVLFDGWAAEGVTDLRAWLTEDMRRATACARSIVVLKVNQKTLSLFGARDQQQLVENLGLVFRDDMMRAFQEEMVQLWDGRAGFASHSVNYTLDGDRLDIQLHGRVLPGHEQDWSRVLVAIEDVTERELARRRLTRSDAYARGLFEHSPISLWVEDFSAVRHLLEDLRDRGIRNFRTFTDVHPEFVDRCMQEIRVIDINQHTLEMFLAADKPTLLRRLSDIFRDDMRQHFHEQLIDLWDGKLFQQREVVNYALSGEALHVHMQFSVLPGHEDDWSLVLVALTDITARKKAESYLEFLGKYDALTKLHNRSFYAEELNRLERKGPFPVTIIMVDLNGLKELNDQLGHAAGDALLRRAGEVLNKAVDKPFHAARVGGDEFAVLMPATDERGGLQMMEGIQQLVEMNNQFYPGTTLSLSMGVATCQAGGRLESAIQKADLRMYEEKRAHYRAISLRHDHAALPPLPDDIIGQPLRPPA